MTDLHTRDLDVIHPFELWPQVQVCRIRLPRVSFFPAAREAFAPVRVQILHRPCESFAHKRLQ